MKHQWETNVSLRFGVHKVAYDNRVIYLDCLKFTWFVACRRGCLLGRWRATSAELRTTSNLAKGASVGVWSVEVLRFRGEKAVIPFMVLWLAFKFKCRMLGGRREVNNHRDVGTQLDGEHCTRWLFKSAQERMASGHCAAFEIPRDT